MVFHVNVSVSSEDGLTGEGPVIVCVDPLIHVCVLQLGLQFLMRVCMKAAVAPTCLGGGQSLRFNPSRLIRQAKRVMMP